MTDTTHGQELASAWKVFIEDFFKDRIGNKEIPKCVRRRVTADLQEAFYLGAQAEWLITNKMRLIRDETPHGSN